MADTLQFDLVSPERRLASLPAAEVRIPGAEGDMTVMAQHMPLITTLRPGILRVVGADGAAEEFAVTGGFAQITADAATVLAERAMRRDEVTAEMMAEMRAEAEKLAEGTVGEENDAARKLAADMAELSGALGL